MSSLRLYPLLKTHEANDLSVRYAGDFITSLELGRALSRVFSLALS